MSWEAFRLTSKSPSELLHTLGPHGVDHLIRQALDALWREHPDDDRSFASVKRKADEVFARNMKAWASIKKASPEAFFQNLLPYAADGFFRQAMVLCWMMMPRAGGRDPADVRKIVTRIYQRNTAAWAADNRTFTRSAPKRKAAARPRAKSRRASRR